MSDTLNAKDAGQAADLLAPHLGALRRLALRLTASHCDAEDLLQNVLLKLYVHRFRLQYVRDLRPWLYRVMYYQFLDQARRAKHDASVPLDAVPGDTIERGLHTLSGSAEHFPSEELTGPELCAFRMQLRDFIDTALDKLDSTQRQSVTLHDLEDLSLPEVAERCGMSLNTLKSALTQARARLRAQLSTFDVLNAQLPSRRRGFAPPPAAQAASYRRIRRRHRPAGSGGARDQF